MSLLVRAVLLKKMNYQLLSNQNREVSSIVIESGLERGLEGTKTVASVDTIKKFNSNATFPFLKYNS